MAIKHGNKVSVIGGAGAVGATVSYVLTQSGLIQDLVLVDIAKEKTEGEALDLNHGASFIDPMNIRAGGYEDTKNSDIVIITAGIAQKPDQTRIELVEKNIEVMKDIIPEVTKYSPNSIILLISNPVDILSYIAYKLSGFPKGRIIGSGTVLDTSRFKFEIGKHFQVDPRDVETYILGEHGDTSFPAWSLTNIKSIPISEYAELMGIEFNEEFKYQAYENVKQAAYDVINKKGATYYAIGLSAMHIVESILKDMRRILPVSTLINDYYGADDLYLGMPCIVGRNGVEEVLKINLSEEEIQNVNKSANALTTVLNESFRK
ncbi:MAG TPA: L-lactate dehydrogenase [Tepidimicrobium sp.]|nr:L-lactate dehydrogenase [Tepidimicrobium sp.]